MSLFLSPDDSITDSIRKIQSIFSDILALCDLARSSSVDWSFSVSYHQYLRSFDSLFIMCKWRNLKITLGHLLIVKVIVYSFNEMRRKKLWYTWLFLVFLCSFVYFILSLFKFISNCFYSSLEIMKTMYWAGISEMTEEEKSWTRFWWWVFIINCV